jgi:hypothetical protein
LNPFLLPCCYLCIQTYVSRSVNQVRLFFLFTLFLSFSLSLSFSLLLICCSTYFSLYPALPRVQKSLFCFRINFWTGEFIRRQLMLFSEAKVGSEYHSTVSEKKAALHAYICTYLLHTYVCMYKIITRMRMYIFIKCMNMYIFITCIRMYKIITCMRMYIFIKCMHMYIFITCICMYIFITCLCM